MLFEPCQLNKSMGTICLRVVVAMSIFDSGYSVLILDMILVGMISPFADVMIQSPFSVLSLMSSAS